MQPRRLRYRMLWNAAVVLSIIVAFGGALFALATDVPRRPSDGVQLSKGVGERDGILDRVSRKTTRPPEGTFLGDTDPRSKPT
jgi:hypothetical protein